MVKKMDLTNIPGLKANGMGACLSCVIRLGHPIKRINISNLKLPKEAAAMVAIFLSNQDINLEELNAAGNYFTSEGFEKLYENLKGNDR